MSSQLLPKIVKRRFISRPDLLGYVLIGVALEEPFEYEYWIPTSWDLKLSITCDMIHFGTRQEYDSVVEYLVEVNGAVASAPKSS